MTDQDTSHDADQVSSLYCFTPQEQEQGTMNDLVSRQFRHKVTGEILTEIPLLSIGDYDEVKYRYQVNTYGDPADSFCGNAVVFATAEGAHEAVKSLFQRWTAVKFWRVVDDLDAVIFEGP